MPWLQPFLVCFVAIVIQRHYFLWVVLHCSSLTCIQHLISRSFAWSSSLAFQWFFFHLHTYRMRDRTNWVGHVGFPNLHGSLLTFHVMPMRVWQGPGDKADHRRWSCQHIARTALVVLPDNKKLPVQEIVVSDFDLQLRVSDWGTPMVSRFQCEYYLTFTQWW